MYQFSYDEAVDDGTGAARQREREALQHSIELLEGAETAGGRSREAIESVLFTRRLWAVLIDDLVDGGNDLPDTLRADLISIGLWIMRECEFIRTERSTNFRGIIEVSRMIEEGLR